MKIKQGEVVISRKLYKEIKSYDRQQMNNFCKTLYESGVEDGQKSVKGIDLEDIKKAIAEVKGIGEKRMQNIIMAIEELYQ